MDTPRLAFGYIRFSDDKQAEGTSHARQSEAIVKCCEENKWTLQDRVYFDSGKSAFKGHHLKGQLGEFIKDCEEGVIPKGSVLAVEAMDRLSRLGNINGQELVRKLLEHVDVYIVDKQLHLTYKKYDEDIGIILQVALYINAAWDYSRRLSNLLKSAIEKKTNLAREGKGKVPGKYPCWLTRSGDTFNVIEEKRRTLLKIVELRESNMGVASIAAWLNERHEEYPVISKAKMWNKSFVKHLFQEPSLYGGLQKYIHENGKARQYGEIIENYYPEIISKERWRGINYRREVGVKGRPPRNNPFFGLLTCSECGSPLYLRITKTEYRYVFCNVASSKGGCTRTSGFNLDILINGFLAFNPSYLTNDNKRHIIEKESKLIDEQIEIKLKKEATYKKAFQSDDEIIRDEAQVNLSTTRKEIRLLAQKKDEFENIQKSQMAIIDYAEVARMFRDRGRVEEANDFVRRHYSAMKLDTNEGRLTIVKLSGKSYMLIFDAPKRGKNFPGGEIPSFNEVITLK